MLEKSAGHGASFALSISEVHHERRGETLHVFDKDEGRRRDRKRGFFMGDARVKACTIQSFKGWETRALVVYVENAKSLKDRALVYVGLSRLKRHPQGSFLTVVCSAPELAAYGRTWPDPSA